MRRASFDHEFVEFIPSELEEGVLYVSVQYATAVHNCACGCGNKVVTPISPADWQLLFDGDSISLMPSIGNWEFPCRSHYWIKSDKVRWAEAWTPERIAAGRQREARDYEQYFASRQAASNSTSQTEMPSRLLCSDVLRQLLRKRDAARLKLFPNTLRSVLGMHPLAFWRGAESSNKIV